MIENTVKDLGKLFDPKLNVHSLIERVFYKALKILRFVKRVYAQNKLFFCIVP